MLNSKRHFATLGIVLAVLLPVKLYAVDVSGVPGFNLSNPSEELIGFHHAEYFIPEPYDSFAAFGELTHIFIPGGSPTQIDLVPFNHVGEGREEANTVGATPGSIVFVSSCAILRAHTFAIFQHGFGGPNNSESDTNFALHPLFSTLCHLYGVAGGTNVNI